MSLRHFLPAKPFKKLRILLIFCANVSAMNRLKSSALIFFFLLAFIPSAFAVEIAPEGTMQRILQRGFLNIALSPFEITHEVVHTQKYETALPTWIAGLVKGSAKTVGRALTGAYEIVTLPLPAPAHYAPVLQPEFPWDLLNNKVRPSVKEKETA